VKPNEVRAGIGSPVYIRGKPVKVAPSCPSTTGYMVCATHRVEMQAGIDRLRHIEDPTKTHLVYWWCGSHLRPEAID